MSIISEMRFYNRVTIIKYYDNNRICHSSIDDIDVKECSLVRLEFDDYNVLFRFICENPTYHNVLHENCTAIDILKNHVRLSRDINPSMYKTDVIMNIRDIKDGWFKGWVWEFIHVTVKQSNEELYNAIVKNEMTTSLCYECDEMLRNAYHEQLLQNSYQENLRSDIACNFHGTYQVVRCVFNRQVQNYIYVEKDYDIHQVIHREIHTYQTTCAKDVTYGYGIKDVFTLPDYIEVDDVMYIRLDFDVDDEDAFIFTEGKVLCSVEVKK